MFMRYLAAAAFLTFAANAGAIPVALTLTDVSGKNTNNPEDIQCIIYGNSCPGGFQDMAALNYKQGGNTTSYDLFDDPNQEGKNESKPVIDDYTVGYLEGFVGRVFSIGIDVNTADHQERLINFEVIVDGNV